VARAAALLGLVVLAMACSPSQSQPVPRSVESSASDRGYRLTLRVAADRYPEGAPIELATMLENVGGPTTTLVGSGSGLIALSFEQVGGSLRMGGIQTADCAPYEVRVDKPLVPPFQKSVGYSDDDPNAAFYKAYWADPVLHLPRGTWRITAASTFTLRECGGDQRQLTASVTIAVE
jgi:hypothetical protein